MWVEYNGVRMTVTEFVKCDRSAVYTPDRVDLLYVRWSLGFVCSVAPGGWPKMLSATSLSPNVDAVLKGNDTTAATLKANAKGIDPLFPSLHLETDDPSATIPTGSWYAGPQTDAEVRNRLMIPRKKLIVWAWDMQSDKPIKWLESPRKGMTVDAAVGPTPIGWDVVSASGEPNSMMVLFQINTDVSPCPMGSDRYVLSHRWETMHGYNQDQYLTKKIEGDIVFHGGVRDLLLRNPDWIRNQFFHPVSLGMQRESVMLVGASDGLSFHYTILDSDPTIVFSPGDSGATQMTIAEKITTIMPLGDETPF